MSEETQQFIGPDGQPLVESLATATIGALGIEPTWYEIAGDGAFTVEGNSALAEVAVYSESGERTHRARVRLVVEEVVPWSESSQ